MNFMIYDIALLIVFVIFFSIFLYRGRKNLKKDGLLVLYKTKWGMRFIDYVGKKYPKTFNVMSYVSIGVGYILMIGVIYMFYSITKIYLFNQSVVEAVKVPPITPLIPYLPQMFKLSYLPDFYFSYWIIILAIIAITHEFAHGIFMRHYKIKIKSTGFAFFPWFFPIFPAAFVEQDEKSMIKSKKLEQMAVLSAGTFANLITAILTFIVFALFFLFAFSPTGVTFDTYPYGIFNSTQVSSINGIYLENPNYENVLSLMGEGFNEVKINEKSYIIDKESFIKSEVKELFEKENMIFLFYDAPAIKANLTGAITKIDGENIESLNDLEKELVKKTPGQRITITTKTTDGEKNLTIVLDKNPVNENLSWLGIGFFEEKSSGISGKIFSFMSSFKESHVYYESKFEGGLIIYNFLWWLILISISVALVNMLPVGIFDGGRFFYLTILGITKNEKIARKSFAIVTYLFLILVLWLMIKWASYLFLK